MNAHEGFEAACARARATPGRARVVGFIHNGTRYWPKRVRDRGLVLRLQKGAPMALLDRERRAIVAMQAARQTVPQLLTQGQDHFVLSDTGLALDGLWRADAAARHRLAEAGANAHAGLHAAGMAHGSPHLRNLTLSHTGEVGFIDLEQATVSDAKSAARQRDIAVFVYALFGLHASEEHVIAALAAYARVQGKADVVALSRLLRRWRWLAAATMPLRWHERRFRPNRSPRIYDALARTLQFFSRLG